MMVRLYAPVPSENDWSCRYEIVWPEGLRSWQIYGVDGMQALILALQCIGSEIYASKHHASGALSSDGWESGYGFPVAQVTKPHLVGEDQRFFG
ncbi:MAG: DUF6968 family protein [Beijerinckiaceae bacterium]